MIANDIFYLIHSIHSFIPSIILTAGTDDELDQRGQVGL